jgi:acetyl esterase
VDPELAAALTLLPQLPFDRLEETRRTFDALVEVLPPVDLSGMVVEERTIPGPAGAPEVPVRIFRPEDGGSELPGVLDIHGGGFAIGRAILDDPVNAAIVREVGAVVVSVDYRLAPETPYPGPAEDCYAALRWFADSATDLGVDPARIAVLGDSAGGGLAATTALLARDRGGPALAMQALIEPELDDRLETHSMVHGEDTAVWNRPNAVLSLSFNPWFGRHWSCRCPVRASSRRRSGWRAAGS